MGIQIYTLKCPECGASLDIEEGRKQIFCSYCGSKLLLHDNNEFTIRYIDEAKVQSAKTEHAITLNNIELSQSERKEHAGNHFLKKIMTVGISLLMAFIMLFRPSELSSLTILSFCGLALMLMWLPNNSSNMEQDNAFVKSPHIIRIPDEDSVLGKPYADVVELFENIGFTHVKAMPLKDLKLGLFARPDTVEDITINGTSILEAEQDCYSDARIVITYHSFTE